MVTCERCHRKFPSYTALEQHYSNRHPNVRKPSQLESRVIAEKESASSYKASLHSRGGSRIRVMMFVLILIVAVGVTGYVALTPREQGAKKLVVGSVAPDFSLPDTQGGMFRLSEFRGKSNVLLFFNEGLSCQPCLRQMRDLDELNQRFVEHHVILVSVTADPLNLLTDWTRASGPKYGKVLSDQNLEVSKAYDLLGPDVSMMPGTTPGHTFILVNQSGVIIWRQDYGPYNMYVPNDQIIAAVTKALGG